jgi:uncharacterized ion transporter superfamily protein YfcC
MFKAPDALAIVAAILILITALTWVIPAGLYDRSMRTVDGHEMEVVVSGTYHRVEPTPQSAFSVFTAPLRGIQSAAGIIAFVLLVGGAFGMLMRTGAIDAGLFRILRSAEKSKTRKRLVIPLLIGAFALCGYSFGMSEETLVFVLITLPLARSMGYDNLVGIAIPFVGAAVGFAGAAFNPFTVGIAQGIAELPLFSGAGYRTIISFVFAALTAGYVMRYAHRIESNASLRFIPDLDSSSAMDETPLNNQRKLVLIAFAASLAGVILGAVYSGWYLAEISGLFVGLGIFAVLICRVNLHNAMSAFYSGAREMLPAALIIGLSKSVLLIATDGQIIDTVLHAMVSATEGLPKAVAVQLMFFVHGAINFFIPSGSGQAAITIPIMAPLADLMGISRQTAVLAFQFGDGLFNLIIPTSGVTMGVLSIAKIPFGRWLRWIMPLFVLLILASMVFLALPVMFFEW